MNIPFIDRYPTEHEVEQFRLILSTYQDGTGMLEKGTLPGWRDFERAVATAFQGRASESKYVYDVLIPVPGYQNKRFYGIDCKMRDTLGIVDSQGYVTIEISNASGEFWDAIKQQGITQEDYSVYPTETAKAILACVEFWHKVESVENGGNIVVEKSCYLTLQWNKKAGEYRLFQYPALLPKAESLEWQVNGRRLVGKHGHHTLLEWYGLSGGQLKYYPLAQDATWSSKRFTLEPLPTNLESDLAAKAASYFPEAWKKTIADGY